VVVVFVVVVVVEVEVLGLQGLGFVWALDSDPRYKISSVPYPLDTGNLR